MKKHYLLLMYRMIISPDGKCRLHKPEEALNTIKGLLKSFREQNLPAIYVQHVSTMQADFLSQIQRAYKSIRILNRWIQRQL